MLKSLTPALMIDSGRELLAPGFRLVWSLWTFGEWTGKWKTCLSPSLCNSAFLNFKKLKIFHVVRNRLEVLGVWGQYTQGIWRFGNPKEGKINWEIETQIWSKGRCYEEKTEEKVPIYKIYIKKKKKQTKKQASLLYFLPLILQDLLQKFKIIMASREKRIKQIRTKEMMGKQNEWFTKHRAALILRLQKQAAHWKKKCYANGITSFYLVFLHWNNPFWC